MYYRAEFDDNSTLSFQANGQDSALAVVAVHAQENDEFTLCARDFNDNWDRASESRWSVAYADSNKPARRVR